MDGGSLVGAFEDTEFLLYKYPPCPHLVHHLVPELKGNAPLDMFNEKSLHVKELGSNVFFGRKHPSVQCFARCFDGRFVA